MSRSLVQPIGQKRLTNVAVVRLKKHGMRFEIACYKNKVLSWRARVEKDIDEVLHSHTVYANVSKGIVAKSKDLLQAFGTDNEDKICLEILEKGELQVAGKERESILSSQFRDIATIVMEKTINPDTQRPYTISMIERFMHDSHFAIDPHRSSKKQALELIKMLEKRFSIARARMKLRLIVPSHEGPSLMNKLASWNTYVEESFDDNNSFLVVCQVEPGYFRACDTLVRESHGRLEVVSMAVQKEGDGTVDESDGEADEEPSSSFPSKVSPSQHDEDLVQGMDSVTLSSIPSSPVLRQKEDNTHPEPPSAEVLKVHRCKTCNADVGDAKQYREHFKSEWHKHNLKRKLKQLQPLSAEECLLDTDITDTINDSNEYCH